MAGATTGSNAIVISALRARANFGRLLQRLENESQSLVIEKRGRARAVLLSIPHYAKLASGAGSPAGHRRRIQEARDGHNQPTPY